MMSVYERPHLTFAREDRVHTQNTLDTLDRLIATNPAAVSQAVGHLAVAAAEGDPLLEVNKPQDPEPTRTALTALQSVLTASEELGQDGERTYRIYANPMVWDRVARARHQNTRIRDPSEYYHPDQPHSAEMAVAKLGAYAQLLREYHETITPYVSPSSADSIKRQGSPHFFGGDGRSWDARELYADHPFNKR